MERRRIGSLSVSVVGLGCNNFGWRLDAAASARVIAAARDAGIDFFDTADTYGEGRSEEYVGRALGLGRGGSPAGVVVATKFGKPMGEGLRGAHPAYLRRAIDASLRRLGTECIDLYQLHEPDPAVPIAETLGALDEQVRAGKVREIGCSNVSVFQLRAAQAATATGAAHLASVQNHYNLLHRDPEDDVLPECGRAGLAFLPYFPLANGLLSGKYRRGAALPAGSRIASWFGKELLTDANLARVEALRDFAAARGRTLLELAVSWLAARREVASVIAGATSPEQVAANAAAAGWFLSGAELAAVDALLAAPPSI